jgi:hypothetical protein
MLMQLSDLSLELASVFIFILLFNKAAKQLKLFAHVQNVLKHTTYPIVPCSFKFTFVFISLAKTTSVLSTRVFTNI